MMLVQNNMYSNKLSLIIRTSFFVCVFFFFGTKETKAQFWKDDSISKKEGVFILPLLYYTPDTRFAAGAMGVYYFRTGDSTSELGRNTRLSYVKLLADYTQNEQLDIWSSWNIFSNQERYLFKGELRYRNFPDRYYGIGNNTPDDNMERYSYDFVSAKILALRQVYNKMFVGLDYLITYQYNFKYFDDKELKQGTVPGYKGGRSSALGFVYTYDKRDNVVSAWEGFLFEVSSYYNNKILGSNFDYTTVNVTFNRYVSIKPQHVLAFNSVANFNSNGVPFIEMAKAGNDDILRGYARNRYRDLNYVAAQVEYRYPIWKRFGGVVFTGIGDVFGKTSDLKFDLLKYTYGGGLRFAINKKERLNVRFDYGWGRDEHSFYITLTEAF